VDYSANHIGAKDAVQKMSGICKARLTEEYRQWRKEHPYMKEHPRRGGVDFLLAEKAKVKPPLYFLLRL